MSISQEEGGRGGGVDRGGKVRNIIFFVVENVCPFRFSQRMMLFGNTFFPIPIYFAVIVFCPSMIPTNTTII